MIKDLDELSKKILSAGSLSEWVENATKSIQDFAKKIQPSSPYKDKAVYNRGSFEGKFWTREDTESGLINIYGISPNAIYIKGANAPLNKWHNTKKYVYFGFKRDKFYTASKAQTLSKSIGIEHKSGKVKGFFAGEFRQIGGGKKLIFGRNEFDRVSVIYAKDSFADYLYKYHFDEIERLIFESGMRILNK